MFEKLFNRSSVIDRHEHAPYKEERERYLAHCEREGYKRSTLRLFARELLWIARKVHLDPERGVTMEQVKAAARGWAARQKAYGQPLNTRWIRRRFIQTARTWLRFLGYWREPEQPVPFAHLIDDFKAWMENERGFTPATVIQHCGYLKHFFLWYNALLRPVSALGLGDIDAFLTHYGARCTARKSVKSMAGALRTFFTYAGTQGLCRPSIAQGIHGPRTFAEEHLPSAPSWEDVQRLLASMETEHPTDIRDRAIVLLLAVYGLRSIEVRTLRLEDIDWEQNLLLVPRAKRRARQLYPLTSTVGNAIIRYVREVRPRSSYRELFLTLVPPFRPLTGLYPVSGARMVTLGIRTPHRGPHALRHACAARLVTEGFSLKEIGDHLGHRSSRATRTYARIDLPHLREVALFDLGGLS
jgi:integrase/recombinase XerD